MDRSTVQLLRIVGGQLAVVGGMLHVALGLRAWAVYATGGLLIPPDVRVPLWIVSGLAVLVGVVGAVRGWPRRPLYWAGIAVMVGWAVGYYAWHLGGHRPLLVVGPGALHDTDLLTFFVEHTFAGPIELTALVTEVAVVAILVVLLYHDREDGPGRGHAGTDASGSDASGTDE